MSILQMSVSAGTLVIAIVIIRTVALNRLPKTMFLVLWFIALCRLLVPVSVSIPSQFTVYNAVSEISNRVALIDPVPVFENALQIGSPSTGVVGQIPPTAQEPGFGISPITIIWLAGMLGVVIFFTVVYIRNYRELRFALPICDNEFLSEWLTEHRLLRRITMFQSDRIATPIAVGILKPRIILPKSMNMDDKQLLQYVLTHEYFHIRRFDVFWKLLLAFALCIHWFNPLVWVMFIVANRDLELTCDEMVVRRFGTDNKTAYAYSLIGMAEQREKFTPLYNGFSKNAAEERIVSIMKFKKASVITIVLAVLLTAGSVLVFTLGNFNAFAAEQPPVQPENPSATINLAKLDTDTQQYIITSVNHVTSRPQFEFYIDGKDIAKIELHSETEYLNIIDWTETQTDPYDMESRITDFGTVTFAKSATLEFDEGFSDYGEIWYRWWGYNVNTWAAQDNYTHIMKANAPDDLSELSEEEKLQLAAGNDGSGRTGVGHIQLDEYPPELLKDRITVVLTDRQGNTVVKYINVEMKNDVLNQLNITVSLEP